MSRVDDIINSVKKSGTEKKKSRVETIIENSSKGNLNTGVDQKYIDTFVKDANDFLTTASKDYDSIGWATASSSYDSRNTSWKDLNTRANTIDAWLNTNRNNLDSEIYDSFKKTLDDIRRNGSSVVGYFKKASDLSSKFETEEDYNNHKIGWLNPDAEVNAESAAARKEKYQSNSTRITELEEANKIAQQLQERERQIRQGYARAGYGSSYDARTGKYTYSSAIEDMVNSDATVIALRKQLEKYGGADAIRTEMEFLKAQNTRYEHIHQAEDDHFIPITDEVKQTAAKRDYSNASMEDLNIHDAGFRDVSRYLGDGVHYLDDNGNVVNSYTGKVVRPADEYSKAMLNNDTEGFYNSVIQDKLGMFNSASEDDMAEAYNRLSASHGNTSDVWANTLRDGDVNGWKQLTEDEITLYYYKLATEGQEAAYKFLEDMTTELTRRATNERAEEISEAEGFKQFALNVASIPMNVFGGVTAFAEDTINTLSGKDINPYSAAHAWQNDASVIREETAKDLDALTGGIAIPWIDFSVGDAYQAIMSGADSFVGAVTLGGTGYGITMGMGAASSTAKDLYERGASRGQIIVGSLAAGVAEGIFEKYSIESFINMGDTKTKRDFVINMLKQGGIEASEEAFTEIANIITDSLIMGSQAEVQDWGTLIKNVVNASLSGFISGSGMGAVGSIGGYADYVNQIKAQGQDIIKNGGVDALVQFGIDMSGDMQNAEGQKIATLAGNVAQKASAKNVGRLNDQLTDTITKQNRSDIKKALVKKGLSEKDADRVSEYLFKASQGYEFSEKEAAEVESNQAILDVLRDVVGNPESASNVRAKGFVDAREGKAKPTASKTTAVKEGSATTLEEASKKYGEQAQAMVHTYVEGQDVAKYDKDYQLAYDMGKEGVELSYALKSEAISYISKDQVQLAYEAGAAAAGSAKGKITYNGKDIKIASVASVNNGVVMLRLADGSEVNASDIEFSNEEEALLYDAVADMDTDTANDFIRGFNASKNAPLANPQTVEDYKIGFEEARTFGELGISYEALARDGVHTKALFEEQKKIAYERGKINGNNNAKSRTKTTTKASITYKGEIRASEIKNSEMYQSLTDTQKAGVDGMILLYKALGKDVYFFESPTDANGKRKGKNGYFNPKDNSVHIDLFAGNDGKGTILFTAGHELTHYIRYNLPEKFKVFAGILFERYEANGVSVATLIAKKKSDLRKKGRLKGLTNEQANDLAYEETVADACESMLANGEAFVQISKEIKAKDKTLWETIKDFFTDIVAKLKEFYANLTPDSVAGSLALDMLNTAEDLRRMWVDMLVESSKIESAVAEVVESNANPISTNEIITDGAVVTDGNGKKYSIRSMKHDITEGQMFRDLMTYCGFTTEQVGELKEQLEDLVEYMNPYRDIVDLNETYGREGRRYAPYKPNSDPLYTISLDFSTQCSKRLLTQYVIEKLQLRENRPMSPEEQMAIRDMLKEYGKVEKALQVACVMCYVEAARLKAPKQIQKWLDDPATAMRNFFADKNPEFSAYIKEKQADFKESRGYDRNATKKDMSPKDRTALNKIRPKLRAGYTPSAEEMAIIETASKLPNSTYLTAGNLADLSETHPEIYKAYTAFIRTATRSKALETDEPYYYGDSRRDNGNGIIVSDSFIEAVNRENGMRFSSWSDWRIQHLLDWITAVIDNSVRKAAMHGYTKYGDEVRVLGKTGMMFNLSGVAGTQTGLNEDGSLNFSDTESVDIDEAIELREEFPETAGLQCIGVSVEHIYALLRSDIIDYVIPYHTSGLNATLRRMGDIYGWKDFTQTQHATEDKSIKKEDAIDPENWHKEPVFSEFFVGYDTGLNGVEAMRKSAENYKRMCRERGLRPKFNEFANEPNYWKLLIDRKMVNQKTNTLIKQRAVTPVFDFNVIKGIVDKYVANYDSGLEERAFNHIVENWDNIPKRIRDLKKQGGTKAKKTKKAVDKLANETIAVQPKGVKNSDRDNVGINAIEDSGTMAADFVTHMEDLIKTRGEWYTSDVTKYVDEHPELNFIDRIYEKDAQVKKDLDTFLNTISDERVLFYLSWYMGEAYGDKDRTWDTWESKASFPYRGAVRTFRNAIKKRTNAIQTEKVGGTNLGVKNGEASLADIKDMFYRLNSNEEIGKFAEKVFATAEKLGVNIRFVNQTFSKKKVDGDNFGDMVEYKTSYFNDTAFSDQHKARTLLHELIHACTVYVLHPNRYHMGDVSYSGKSENYQKLSNAATRLNRIYSEIMSDPSFKGQYGIKNVNEMVAELSNEDFVGLLKEKNLWQRIVDWICELFGINRGTSAYENARMCIDYILDNPEISEYKKFAGESRQQGRRNGMDIFGKTIDENGIMYSDRVLMGSLFSGGGTLEAGLVYQMLDKQFGVEYDDKIASVYADNHGDHVQVGRVEDFDIGKYDDIFYLHASPVCHNFSRAKHGAKELQMDIDSAKATAKHLETSMPQVFTVENAPGYRKSQSLKIITDKLTELGYKWDVDVYNSADYGSATSRNRVILRAVKDGELPEKPTKQDRTNSWDKVTRDLWDTLPKSYLRPSFISAIENTKNLPILDANGNVNVNKPLLILTTTSGHTVTYCWEGEICPTLTTKCGEAKLVMPDGNIYAVTPEFMGRIQGLPDDYKYPKAKTRAFTIIGNGIPTHLTKAVIGGVLDSAYEQTHNGEVLYSDRDSYSEGLSEADKETAKKVISGLKINAQSAKYGIRSMGTYTDERIDREIRTSSSDTVLDYAKSYITWVDPIDFIYATTTSEQVRQTLKDEAGDLDIERLRKQTQPIHLTVDFETGEIVGHEGRHRMLALQKAGVEKVAVVIDAWNDDRHHTKPIEFMKLEGQNFGRYSKGTGFLLHNVLPLSKRYAEEAKKLFSIEPTSGVRFSDRSSDSVSNRSLLANALESVAQDDIERNKLAQYKEKISLIESEQKKLTELRAKIKELSFAKGTRDTKAIEKLQFEANQTANRINTYDRQLLNLESTKALKGVLEREKKMAYNKAMQEGREALKKQREKDAKRQREMLNRYKDQRKEQREKANVRRDKTELKRKIRKVVKDLDHVLNHGTKDRNVKDEMRATVSKSLLLAEMLFSDDIRNEDIVRLGVDSVTEKESKLLDEYSNLLDTIDTLVDKRESFSGTELVGEQLLAKIGSVEEQIAKAKNRISTLDSKLSEVFERERARLNKATADQLVADLATEYLKLKTSESDYIRAAFDEYIHTRLEALKEAIGGTIAKDMSVSQLTEVYDAYKMVEHFVRSANKAFKAAKGESISTIANGVIAELEAQRKSPKVIKGLDTLSQFDWNNLKPVYAFERIGSANFTKVFNNVRAGEDTWAIDMSEAQAFREAQYKKHDYDSFDLDKKYDFVSSTGHEFSLTLGQIMSLYAYSKRGPQAKEHLKYGGFQFDGVTEIKEKKGKIFDITYQLKDSTTYKISDDLLAEIIGVLEGVEGAKDFVDEMQKYLSDTMGAKGNEVSLELYGVKLFNEENYFPLRVSQDFLERAREQAMGDVKIKNSGFSQATIPNAKNPIVLSSFMDVWANHVNEMSMYHAFVLPLEDFYRVFNYGTPTDDKLDTVSVVSSLRGAHRDAAVQYIDQLLKDLNGGARSDPRETLGKALMSNFKKAAVMASLSVVVQQPTAIARAMALVDAKYFVGNKVSKGNHKEMWAEVKKYAPVAIIKEMGYFDTGMGKGSVEWLKGEQTWMDKVDDALSKAPALADEITWVAIWNAVKRETLHTHKHLQPNSEAFLQAVGERFTEVITKTQVYDSTLSRSANMRSKGAFMNMVTSFMAEPTTSINMLIDALRKGNKKHIARTFGAVYGSVILNSLLVSIIYAMRDDDEDETFLEKYLSRLTTEVIDGINPLTYIPFVKDIWSLAQGFDVERADMSLINDLLDSLQQMIKVAIKDTDDMDEEQLSEHKKSVVEAFASIVDNISSLTGVPVKNVRRDIKGVINLFSTIGKDVGGRKTTAGSLADVIGGDVKDSIPVWGWFPDESKTDKLYDAIIKGDEAYADRLKSGYKNENSAFRKALRDNDPRIKEAAEARYNGDISEYMRIAKEIIAEGNFIQDDVVSAINSEIAEIKKRNGETETSTPSDKVKSIFKIEDYYAAVVGGDRATAYAVKEDLISTDVANGKDRDEAESAFNSNFTSHIRELYEKGEIITYEAKNMLVNHAGKSEEEAASKVQYWDFKKKYPDYDLSEDAVKKYYSEVEPAGINIDVYYDYSKQRAKCKGADMNGDGKTDSGSVKSEVLIVINSLPISSYQKDILYYLNGWSASTLREAPWH